MALPSQGILCDTSVSVQSLVNGVGLEGVRLVELCQLLPCSIHVQRPGLSCLLHPTELGDLGPPDFVAEARITAGFWCKEFDSQVH